MSSDSAVNVPQHCTALQQTVEQATALGCKWNIFLLQFTLFSVLRFHSTRECKFITSQFRVTLILPWGFSINLGYINHTFQLLPIYSVVVCASSRRHWFMFHRLHYSVQLDHTHLSLKRLVFRPEDTALHI